MITVVVTMAQNCFCWIILNFCPDNTEKYWIQQFECFSQKGKNKTHFFLHFEIEKKCQSNVVSDYLYYTASK